MKTLLSAMHTNIEKEQHTKLSGSYVLCLKRIFFTLPMLFLLCVISNCGSGTRGSKPLKQLVGTWKGSATVVNKAENLFTVTSGSFAVKHLSLVTIGFEHVYSAGVMQFGVPGVKTCKVSLKNDPSSNGYLLSFVIDSSALFENFPLQYLQGEGFVGRSTASIYGKQRVMSVSIKASGSGFIWSVSADEEEPAIKYEFDMEAASK